MYLWRMSEVNLYEMKWNVYVHSERGNSSAVGRGRAGYVESECVSRNVSIYVHVIYR
jgi:hypothetical protein